MTKFICHKKNVWLFNDFLSREDGNTDMAGRIVGHGVSSTGVVRNIEELTNQVRHATNNSSYHTFNERCRCFEVECKFTNKFASEFIFTISDTS